MKTFPLARMIVPSLILIASNLAVQTAGAQAPAAAAPTTCKDGTSSTATGRGACSGHGGVQKAAAGGSSSSGAAAASTPSSSPAASAPPASGSAMKAAAGSSGSSSSGSSTASTPSSSSSNSTTTGNTDPTGATAKCKDGTYSKSKHHSGTCSKHGGVDQWMDGSK
ncbi:MAG TPA: DUF3761 domain-containing protein [Steroidobacteraceae bacterium]|jgi:Protein of unknown function (DUF3761)|nr:DUF3761 domain-containing protein [Steroidobacteraceae bacterium]